MVGFPDITETVGPCSGNIDEIGYTRQKISGDGRVGVRRVAD
jgi:hypothetical protein